MADNQGVDPLTGESFEKRRENQVFACRRNQVKYNNLKARNIRLMKSPTEKPLHRNFMILNQLMNGNVNEKVFHKQFLLGIGVSLKHYTGADVIDNVRYFKVFNYIFQPLPNEYFKIVKQ
jgi:hypothetical protein